MQWLPAILRHLAIAVPGRGTLRAKAMLAAMGLLLYALAAVVMVTWQRARVEADGAALQRLVRHEKAIALAESAVAAAIVDAAGAGSAVAPEPAALAEMALYVESCGRLFTALAEFDAGYAPLERAVLQSWQMLQAAPLRARWVDLHESLGHAADALAQRRAAVNQARDALTTAQREHSDSVARQIVLFALVGVGGGLLAAGFVGRLARDIGRLEAHARQIVHGTRGVALAVSRDDELGRLMQAVNRLSNDLDAREQRLELDSLRRSHADQMIAVGALAAGMAHEVNNPLTVISGVAQELDAAAAGAAEVPAQRVASAARDILAQAQRAAAVARDLAREAAPQPAEYDWIDVNALLRGALQLLRYDQRYRQFGFDFAPGADVPALHLPAASLQQVLMQLLRLACHATPASGSAWLRLSTHAGVGEVQVCFQFAAALDADSGDAARTLSLCGAMIEPLGGRLALSQDARGAARINLTLPAVFGGEPGR